MSARYLLDSNILSEALRPSPSRRVLARLDAATGELALPTIVWHELLYGAARLETSRRRAYLEKYLAQVVLPSMALLPYDQAAAEWHAKERARLEKRGSPPSFVDGQIAAIAATRGMILVSRNVRDFERFEGLALENWFESE
ncbi:MAG: type II toxin-antitoxin system VapC family toxin [Archangium sp.]|nr:type II toxin-antitoxin system VapC family toxin [Archangium sp.]